MADLLFYLFGFGCYAKHKLAKKILPLGKSKPAKQEVSHTGILTLTK